MQRLALTQGAHILVPSMGVGHFFGLIPDGLLPGSHRPGVKLDSVSPISKGHRNSSVKTSHT
jgi:hypothetical protein